jgi:beta-mannanase
MSFAKNRRFSKLLKVILIAFTFILLVLFIPNILQDETSEKVNNKSDIENEVEKSAMTQVKNNQKTETYEELPEDEVLGETKKRNNINFGVVVEKYSNETGEISAIESQLGINVSTVGIFKQFGLPTNNNLVTEDLAFIKSSGKTLLLTWEPWNPQEGINQSIDFLSEIINGTQDDYISSFAQQVKNYNSPVLLRFAHEMNGNWYPWGNRPAEYVNAYRKVVDVFRENGVDNVRFVWCINSDNVPYTPIENSAQYYPGNAYVDYIGIDGFNFGTSQSSSEWRNFAQIFLPSYSFVESRYPGKPIFIAETASSEFGGNKSEWINGMFIALADMPEIGEIIWFNLLKETDWRIDSSQSSLEALRVNLYDL